MVARKDRNYKDHQPLIVMETPISEGEKLKNGQYAPNIPAMAVGFIDRCSTDPDDRRTMFEALGYVPYVGGNTHVGKLQKVKREPLWKIAKKVLDNHGK